MVTRSNYEIYSTTDVLTGKLFNMLISMNSIYVKVCTFDFSFLKLIETLQVIITFWFSIRRIESVVHLFLFFSGRLRQILGISY